MSPARGDGADMNWDRIRDNWKQVAGKTKEQWGQLTDGNLDAGTGRGDPLAGEIQERHGAAKGELEKQAVEWQQTATDLWFDKS